MSVYIYILVMAVVTYLIRVLPLTVFKKRIKSQFILSFLHYVPYACLSAMVVPAIFSSTSSLISAICGFAVAVVLGFFKKGLVTVALSSTIVVFVVEIVIKYL